MREAIGDIVNMLANRYAMIALVAVLALVTGPVHADTDHFARDASDSIVPFIVIGEATLLSVGKQEAVQGAKSLIVTGLATEFLKVTVREKRPNSDARSSFPSGHTSAAFAMATSLADYKPKLAIPAYAIAATIGWSRVEVGAHTWGDVIAGAALGYYTAKRYTGSKLTLSPDGIDYSLKW
jgi:membrane-associated phospholipid phosphatase